jgi:hypothetical protein
MWPRSEPEPDPSQDDEWTYLMDDIGETTTCDICGKDIHRYQAVGYVKGQTIHARCYTPRHRVDRAEADSA